VSQAATAAGWCERGRRTEAVVTLLRTGPFREVDRLTQQFFGATTPPPSRQ
jgi:hypothetical protein